MLCSPKRLVLLASALSSLASCRSLCRPRTQSSDTSAPSTNVPPISPSTTYPSMGSSDNNVSTSNNNSMMMPDTPPTTTPSLTSPIDNLPTSSGNDSSIGGSNATGSSEGSTPEQPSTNASTSLNDTQAGSSSTVGDLPDTNAPSTNTSSISPSTNSSSTTPGSSLPDTSPVGLSKGADQCLPRVNGANMAGLDFGMDTNGALSGRGFVPPPLDQLTHFLKDDHMNIIRFPIGWQYVQPQLNAELNATYLAILDQYITATTQKNAYAIIDLHNYARLDGKIVGQDLPADALVDCWTRLAKHYMNQPMVIFGTMNEPHDVDSKKWIDVVQQVVTGIRKASAQNNILLPGNNWCHLKTFADDYNAGLSAIKNPDGSKNGLLLEIHQYFDSDESGTTKECTADHIDTLTSVAAMLNKDGRQALVSELGGGSSDSCKAILAKFAKAVSSNYPAIAGQVIWGAGAFAADYPLVVAIKEGSGWKDQINVQAIQSVAASTAAS